MLIIKSPSLTILSNSAKFNGSSNLTTQEFDQLANVEVTSDGISGTQILFAPDSNSQSGKLVLPNIEESFDTDWTATTYTVEIIADSNLA